MHNEEKGQVSSESGALLLFSGGASSCSSSGSPQGAAPPLTLHADVFDPLFCVCLNSVAFKARGGQCTSGISFRLLPPCIPPFDSHRNTPVQVSSSGAICKPGNVSQQNEAAEVRSNKHKPAHICLDMWFQTMWIIFCQSLCFET